MKNYQILLPKRNAKKPSDRYTLSRYSPCIMPEIPVVILKMAINPEMIWVCTVVQNSLPKGIDLKKLRGSTAIPVPQTPICSFNVFCKVFTVA